MVDPLAIFLPWVGQMADEVVRGEDGPALEVCPSVALVACIEIVVWLPTEKGDTHVQGNDGVDN